MARFNALFLAAFVAFAAAAPTALASHNGNNAAELSGPGDSGATGKAIVNYSEGRGDFNGTITVRNLEPGVTYSFFVRFQSPGLPIEDTLICSGEANQQGTFTCQAQHLTLGRFTSAVVLDTGGDVVAAGAFERRGNCRDPEQFMSQCDAPGHNK